MLGLSQFCVIRHRQQRESKHVGPSHGIPVGGATHGDGSHPGLGKLIQCARQRQPVVERPQRLWCNEHELAALEPNEARGTRAQRDDPSNFTREPTLTTDELGAGR